MRASTRVNVGRVIAEMSLPGATLWEWPSSFHVVATHNLPLQLTSKSALVRSTSTLTWCTPT